MTEDTGRHTRNRIGNFLEANKRSWQRNQAKYVRVRAELPLDKVLHKGGYLMSMEGEKLWVTFKYEILLTVCYICGRLGHDDMYCMATKARQVTEYQYGDWIKANGGYWGGQDKTKPRKEEHQPSSNDNGQTNAQPTAAEKTMTNSEGGSKRYDVDKAAEKQVCWGDVGDNGGSGS